MKQDYIIWDWNGTLFDDVSLCLESINHLLTDAALPLLPDVDAYRNVFCFPIIRYYERIGFDFTKRSFAQLAKDYMEYYHPRSLTCELHRDATQALDYFYRQGFTQVLLSASNEAYLHEQLEQFSIRNYFRDIVALQDIHARSKLELAKDYVKKHRDQIRSITCIGDSVHDYEVAQAIHAKCILIADGHEHKDRLLQTGACVKDHLHDIWCDHTLGEK